MKEYKIGGIFQWEDRTLMCVEVGINGDSSYFTNNLIFSTEGLTIQIKRKDCKVKVKVLELSDEFEKIKNDKITISVDENISSIYKDALVIDSYNTKYKYYFPTEQEAIDWVEALFSLRGE